MFTNKSSEKYILTIFHPLLHIERYEGTFTLTFSDPFRLLPGSNGPTARFTH